HRAARSSRFNRLPSRLELRRTSKATTGKATESSASIFLALLARPRASYILAVARRARARSAPSTGSQMQRPAGYVGWIFAVSAVALAAAALAAVALAA